MLCVLLRPTAEQGHAKLYSLHACSGVPGAFTQVCSVEQLSEGVHLGHWVGVFLSMFSFVSFFPNDF